MGAQNGAYGMPHILWYDNILTSSPTIYRKNVISIVYFIAYS